MNTGFVSRVRRLTTPTSTTGRAVMPILGGLVFLGVLAGALWLIASQVSSGRAGLRVGKDVFDNLRYEPLAADIDVNGPRLYPSLIGADQSYLYVSHVGADATKGWFAFRATANGQPNRCTVVWKPKEKVFADPCSGATYPPTGAGLQQYDAIPNFANGRLVIDLKHPLTGSPGSTAP